VTGVELTLTRYAATLGIFKGLVSEMLMQYRYRYGRSNNIWYRYSIVFLLKGTVSRKSVYRTLIAEYLESCAQTVLES
jgi:hypothetical protein